MVLRCYLVLVWGIGLVFYGAAEPMADFASPPNADPKTTEAYAEALRSTFSTGDSMLGLYGVLHWL